MGRLGLEVGEEVGEGSVVNVEGKVCNEDSGLGLNLGATLSAGLAGLTGRTRLAGGPRLGGGGLLTLSTGGARLALAAGTLLTLDALGGGSTGLTRGAGLTRSTGLTGLALLNSLGDLNLDLALKEGAVVQLGDGSLGLLVGSELDEAVAEGTTTAGDDASALAEKVRVRKRELSQQLMVGN